MSLILYKKLWHDEGYIKDNPLENSINYVKAYARKVLTPKDVDFLIKKYPNLKDLADIIVGSTTVADEIADIAIAKVFAEVEIGRKFSLTKCPCGCGIDKSGTAITHEMIKQVDIINDEIKEHQLDLHEKFIVTKLNDMKELAIAETNFEVDKLTRKLEIQESAHNKLLENYAKLEIQKSTHNKLVESITRIEESLAPKPGKLRQFWTFLNKPIKFGVNNG